MLNNNFIALENERVYIINVERIVDLLKDSEKYTLTDFNISETFTDGTDGLVPQKRQSDDRKITNGQLKPSDNVRFSLINVFIESVLNMGISQQDGGKVIKIDSLKESSIGEIISWNTLLAMGIIEEVVA
jgi:hypothetical protein